MRNMSVKAKLVLQIVLMGIGLLGVSFFGVVGMKLIAKGNPELNAISSQWMGYMAICGGLVFVLLIIAGIIILLSIDRPLREAVELINRMAAGEMTGRADPRRMKTKGEFGELMTSMNTLAKNLDEILTEVQRGSFALSENMNGALTNLNNLNGEIESVSATTEQLSAGMEETSASAQQVDSMAREIETVSKNIAVRAQEGAEKAADSSACHGGKGEHDGKQGKGKQYQERDQRQPQEVSGGRKGRRRDQEAGRGNYGYYIPDESARTECFHRGGESR